MSIVSKASRLARVALLVDQLALTLEADRLPKAQSVAAASQIRELIDLLSRRDEAGATDLAAALGRLSDRMTAVDSRRRVRRIDTTRNQRFARALRRIAIIVAAGAVVAAPLAAAAQTAPAPVGSPVLVTGPLGVAVGDTIIHPTTGASLIVTAVVPNGVIATGNLFILTNTAVGAVLPDPTNPAVTVTIASVHTDATTHLVDSVTFTNSTSLAVVTQLTTAPSAPPGGSITLPAGVGDSGQFADIRRGDGGGGGDDGALFVSADSGGDGQAGPSFSVTAGNSSQTVTTVSANLPGVIAASIGGNGGNGGDGYLGASGASGGNGGAGGDVTLTSNFASISTTGNSAHGVVVQSRSGVGGAGGSGFVFSSGGSGGAGSHGGTATVTNNSDITTRGLAAHGVFAQSLGGGAGGGGGSYGLFGDGGDGNRGGDGGQAEAINNGSITTIGAGSFGVTAQSVGGIGGDAGTAVGLVTFTSDGAAGGNGGTAIVRANATSHVSTEGATSYGLFAQSIGGGGGNGGLSVGLASLGSGGGTGGNGGTAQVFALDGSTVATLGETAHGIFAQSIGGGGGNGGVSAGVVAIGSRGTSGGTGGTVRVESGATVTTAGAEARGIFAQSIGGGGGNALGAGGLVALGGEGGGAGGAGAVTVITSSASSITTTGAGADGIFAQSVGGGGGTGSSTGGLVALGGGGGVGGNGNTVSVENNGLVHTAGDFARGVFAQSVGGGGGAGGDSGGLVTLGGDGSGASTGGAVTVTNRGQVSTAGNMASALQVQSVGGGGGDGGSTGGVFLTIGGNAGGGGGSGLVTVNNYNDLNTTGNDSHGILAQSVGGGGGNGGSSGSVSAFAGAAVGGHGGVGGDGGRVDVNFFDRNVVISGVPTTLSPLIHTTGDRSRGVFAQSVGGGGGNGGFAAQVSAGYGVSASIAVGGDGGTGGIGGEVDIDGDVTIVTEGDYAEGIFAQSVGGGGGNGGFAVSFSFAVGETAAAAFSVGVGGQGGDGGAGGLVDINSGGAIFTSGQFSTGLLAQSVGGGGGNGGFSVAIAGSGAGAASASVSVGVGGSGGHGGAGGTADVDFDGTITTTGDDSRAALVQSVGGGGGNGGFAVSGAVSISGGGSIGAAAGVGGQGGDGGAGGSATGVIGGDVMTSGDRSTAVTVQSVGGGGGSGGFSVAGSIGGAATGGIGVSIGIGGSGGGGGAGGAANGTTRGHIQTTGDQSGGLLVQSVGGGGGNGGFNVSGSIGVGGAVGGAISVGVGGAGGDGGTGGYAHGVAEGTVVTTGNQSTGVTVQSIGGGGGNGGFDVAGGIGGGGDAGGAISVGVGGSGGLGGDAGEVDASAVGITTSGNQSGGFLAQSVGGGGGAGGFNVAGSIGGGGTAAAGVAVGVGGSGGGGGAGMRVGATVVGDVTTLGQDSDAITAQSIGGGGGSGGFNVAGSISGSGTGAGSISVGVGGSGGGGGNSGAVTLDVTGTTQTGGAGSDAIIAQSVGGGGGSGGFNVTGNIAIAADGAGTLGVSVGGTGGGGGDAGAVTLHVNQGVLDPTDTLIAALTVGDGARGVLAQSVGGGGGNGGFSVVGGISAAQAAAGNIGVGVGGGGGDGGDAGAVSGSVIGDVRTGGDDASAVLVQSVGGGGGNGGFNISGGISGSQDVSGNLMVGVGGFGGDGGDAGAVSGAISGDILTMGDRSFGVAYQSLGGGGGNGAFNITGGVALSISGGAGAGNIGVGIGGFGGDGGDASTVNATITGDITTHGIEAYGALLQSVGGGGGNGGFNITGGITASSGVSGTLGFGLGGFGGGAGSGGSVTGVLTGDVTTAGDGSFGAMLQSLGGAGGNGGFNVTGAVSLTTSNNASIAIGIGVGGFAGGGGDAGAVDATVTGRYVTTGNNADGVVAQSLGGGGGNGGLNVSGAIALGTGTSGTGTIGIGGFGGAGGSSGNVDLVRIGDTSTDGSNSDGVIAQSVAGGGGNGAINISGGISASTSNTAGSLGFGLGGFGGGGGDAGDVTAHVTGNVHARGSDPAVVTPEITIDGPFPGPSDEVTYPAHLARLNGSNGVVAQSIGGGGGNGGLNVTGQISITAPGSSSSSRVASLGVGGFGGAGGDAGTVDLTIDAPGADRVQVSAIGDDRSAVIAQSIGGGGGAGGINISGGIAMDGQLTAGVGGFGGGGGLGRDVTVDVDADLFASGDRSRGIMAQSIGGGGGAGGINISGGVTADPAAEEPSLAFGLGGFGGAGNSSGNVTVDQHGQIMVDGVGSIGLLAQSVAGGGGSGGLNVTADITAGSSSTQTRGIGVAVGVGGTGGDGADAGAVDVTSNGNIFVNARPAAGGGFEAVDYTGNSNGILAQSIGGGGGVGGISGTGAIAPVGQPVALGVGGTGGSGGNGGTVSVTRGYTTVGAVETATPGVIRTYGNDSDGLVAQSVGGGGGRAGMNFTFAATVRPGGDNPVAALISVGGGGGGAGSGDDVTVRHNGDIITAGDSSDGLFAQSLGGGGGDADFNIGFGVMRNSTALNLAVGGAVGAGGTGADVVVDHTGTIITNGHGSVGVRAQSIGGGGGNTSLDLAIGILANNSLDITIGRRGGAGGAAGDVTVTTAGAIDTTGDESSGILAHSIGGGGGASSAISVGATRTTNAGTPDAESYSGNISVGLEGGSGATGGDVTVNANGTITTRGDDSRGVFAQSIGGGGGVGGAAGSFTLRSAGSASVNVGGDGGTGATSGHVTVHNTSTIATTGDRSDGVLAQSIGGGGGLAGHARNIAIQVGGVPSGTTTRTASINVGGTGGTGAVGGAVNVTNSGVIATTGELSYGIRAQSIGGGGGVGGAVINFRAQGSRSNDSVDINVGGSGGTGGAGGVVTVANTGLIYTEGRDAAGISANSIGGGGGDAGLVLDVVAGGTGADQQSHRFVATFGGDGGAGGTGGDVTVTNLPQTGVAHTGEIVTRGQGAYGIFAQSIGGGGGNGSSVISITGLKSGSDSITAGLTIGGTGGTGNTGGDVSVTNGGLIDTTGAGAHGILAQSIGGGGGNGGLVIAANALIGASANSPLISIGGTGGDGGDGGDVTVTNTGTIVTRGAGAHGIVAQSIGGGGGNAQMGFSLTAEPNSLVLSNALAAIVGALGGGTGGTGGSVTVNHSGDITVLGEGSVAIKAESINGGGGTLTLDFSGIVGLPGIPFVDVHGNTVTPDPLVVARAGGEGASGMNAGSVTVNSTGTFGVGGNHGVGSFNQAVGGGGGTVTVRAVVATELDPTPAPITIPALAGGSSKDPSAPLISPVEPHPLAAPVIVPVGFQMALGGINGVNNNGGAINSTHSGMILTTGVDTPGALVQSIGGGGGRGIMDITGAAGALIGPLDVSLGGVNGLNESGGLVVRTHTGVILTTGDLSAGAILQSIGGGGGSASVALHGDGATAALLNAGLGSAGGSGLNGGAVSGLFSDGIETRGANAVGLLAQSIGGGGGEMRLTGVNTMNVALGGTGGAAGNGGAVSVTNTGSIVTRGVRSHAVVLQSIGGGGGAVFGAVTAPVVTLNSGNSGDGGAIQFVQTGDVMALGAGSYGVIAQSLGGGGGWIDGVFAGTAGGAGHGGAIDLALSGAVYTPGLNSTAVFAQSLGSLGGGNINLTADGMIRGGSGTGAGVRLDGGATNVITSSGSISAVNGLAIDTTSGNDRVRNDGTVIGDIDLGSGVNAFMNRATGTFLAFHTIDLRDGAGSTGTFTNAGEFEMGLSASPVPIDLAGGATFGNLDGVGDPTTNLLYGARVINTVALDGDYNQTASGNLVFDVAFGPYASDRVNVTGDAFVNGTGDITLTWLENANPVTLFATGGVGVDNGLDITDTLALDYSVHGDGDGIHLSFVSDFGQPFLNENGRSLGHHMDSAITLGGSGGIGQLMALIGNLQTGDEALYAAIFTELNPEPFIAPLQTQYIAADNFSRNLFSCAAPGAVLRDQCVWTRLETASSARDGDFENFSVDGASMRFSAGFERPLSDGWSLAGGIGYENIDHLVIDQGRAQTDGESFQGGLGVRKTTSGGAEMGVSLTGGWQSLDTARRVDVFQPLVGLSDPASGYVQVNARLAQTWRAGSFFVRPALNASITALHQANFVETGLDGLGVQGIEDTQSYGAINPELGLGFVLADSEWGRTAFTVTVGGVWQSEDRIEAPYRLIGSNPAADPAVIGSPLDQEAWRYGFDFQVAGNDHMALRLGYNAEIGDKTDNHTAGFNLRVKF